VLQDYDEGKRFLDNDAIAIHIGWIKETSRNDKAITSKHIVKELGRERCGVRFSLAKQGTDIAVGMILVMIASSAPAHGSHKHQESYQTSIPPLSVCHGFLFPYCILCLCVALQCLQCTA